MVVNKMSLAWISVNDTKKAEKFFTEVLGLKVTSSAPEYGWLEVSGREGGLTLGIGRCDDYNPIKPGMNAVMTMSVDDIVAMKKQMEAKGVLFLGDIIEVPGHVKMATFMDADKNVFQLVQELGE